MRALWIIGATIAAGVVDAMLRDDRGNASDDKLPKWALKLLGR
jgi:hypothetical protein